MARVSYVPLPSDLQPHEIEECPPVLTDHGSAQTMFANLNFFTKDHLVVDGMRVARLQIEMHESTPPGLAMLLVRELANGAVEVRRSPATSESTAKDAVRHIEAYAKATISWV